MKDLRNILQNIGIAKPAQDVYLSLLENGEASARTIAHRTSIARTSVYDHIKILRTKGLIVERMIDGTTFFAVSDVHNLSVLLNEHMEILNDQKKYLTQNMNILLERTKSVQPKIRFFDGSDGVQQMLKNLLWHDDITAYMYWPYDDMRDFLGKEFLTWFSVRRKKHNIRLHVIWGHRTKKINDSIFDDQDHTVMRRHLSQKNIPSMGYMIYDKKVCFISSTKESFGFIVESADYVTLQKMQFDTLWKIAQ